MVADFFLSVTLYIFVCISGIVPFEIESLLRVCLPFTQQRYWFVTTYLLMYVLIPLLNAAIHTMSQRQHAFFIATFFSYTLYSRIYSFGRNLLQQIAMIHYSLRFYI